MKIIILKRLIKSGFTSFLRNWGLSVASTLIMTITLLIISTILIIYTFTGIALDIAEDRVGGITAYFKDNVNENEILEVREEIATFPNVKSVVYVSKEEAKQRFIEIQKLKNRTIVLESLDEFQENENPLPASLTITATTLEDYQAITNSLKDERYIPYFKEISENKKVIDRLSNITNTIQQLGLGLVAIFVVVTIMVMFNTIRLAIYNRRDEVEIMRLVGATNWYIRGPFIIEGIIYALLATITTSAAIVLAMILFAGTIDSFFSLQGLAAGLRNTLTWQLIVLNLVMSILLAIISSSIAMRRYLRI